MPEIKEEDLLKLYNDLDAITVKEENLRKGYIDLKLKSDKINKQQIFKNLAIIILIMLASYLFYSFNKLKTSSVKAITIQKDVTRKSLDSIKKILAEKEIVEQKIKNNVIFSIQVGLYKNFNINQDSNINNSLKKTITKKGLYTYTIGEFFDYESAKDFKIKIKKLGIRDAFLVAFLKGNKLNIKEALKLTKNN